MECFLPAAGKWGAAKTTRRNAPELSTGTSIFVTSVNEIFLTPHRISIDLRSMLGEVSDLIQSRIRRNGKTQSAQRCICMYEYNYENRGPMVFRKQSSAFFGSDLQE